MNLRKLCVLMFVTMLVLLPILSTASGAGKEANTNSTAREGNVLYLFNWNNYIAPETVKRLQKK